MKTVNFLGRECEVAKEEYVHGGTALQLVTMNGDVVTDATIFLRDVTLSKYEVIIKSSFENEGLLEVLVAAKIVEETGRTVHSGFITAPICKLLI